ncbi:MAG: UbiA prenyltransferase family protein [Candidatus Thermoplasmatota archaeon]|nr:UbiA prenyltransferase family protein [Candidatus Thermoplasmatota archaeon]
MNKIFYYLFKWHPFRWRTIMLFELISFSILYSTVPMLAYGIQPYNWDILRVIVFTALTLYSGYFATLIWNDITDREIDSIAHPDRSLPAGRITPRKFFLVALFFSAMVFSFALLISVWCLFIVGMAALFVTFHNKFLKKIIKIPAYSEIFTPVQWMTVAVFGYVAIWSALPQTQAISYDLPILGAIAFDRDSLINMIILVLLTYFADNAHDLPEGIHDIDGDKKLDVRTYATSFGIKTSAKVSFSMFFLSGFLGILLWYRTELSLFFLIAFLLSWFYTLNWSYRYIWKDEQEMKDQGIIIGQKGFNFFLLTYIFIFLDVVLQLLHQTYF